MICRLLRVALLATLFATPAVTASKKPAKDGLDSTLARAAEFCERAATHTGTGIPGPPGGGGVAIHDGTPPAMGTPDLVKRFAQTQPSGRLASKPPFNLHLLGKGGEVWAVVYEGLPTCDVMVTGASGDMPATAVRLAEALRRSGWQIVGSTPATATMPLSEQVLIKKVAKPGTPPSSLKLRLRALSGAAADPAGIQLEMSFLGSASN